MNFPLAKPLFLRYFLALKNTNYNIKTYQLKLVKTVATEIKNAVRSIRLALTQPAQLENWKIITDKLIISI